VLSLPLKYGRELHDHVRGRYEELWQAVQIAAQPQERTAEGFLAFLPYSARASSGSSTTGPVRPISSSVR
jgi:hypothetical protein